MKSKEIILTALALIIRVMVSGQTSGSLASYRLLPVLGEHEQVKVKTLPVEKNQVRVYENSGYTHMQEFKKKQLILLAMLNTTDLNDLTIVRVQQLNTQAEYAMKMAKEMREEAYAETTVPARAGRMSNAEEKEILALMKQDEATQIVEKYLAVNGLSAAGTFAAK